MAEQSEKGYSKGYGKRPLWQWVLLYVVIGGALYYGIYYFMNQGNGLGYY
jgi:hypothetical protein